MASISSSVKINKSSLYDKANKLNLKIKDEIKQELETLAQDVLKNKLQKRIQSDGIWVIDKRGIEKSNLSIFKWRAYIESRGLTNLTLIFRNDAVGKNKFRYTNRLTGKDGEYRSEKQGLTEDAWLWFKENTKQRVKNLIENR